MVKQNTRLETDLLSWLQSSSVDHTADYVDRGRRYLSLQGAELLKQWKDALRLMATDPVQPEYRALYKDLGAEIELRGMEQPYDEVREIFELFMHGAATAIGKILQDPDEASRINEEIVRDVDHFKKRAKDQAQ
jgi:hypothetical protein